MRENQPVVPGLLMIVAAWLAVVALAGCEERGIEQTEAPAGVERPPLDSGGAPGAAATDRAGVEEVDRAAPPAAEGAASSGWPLPAGWRVSPVEAPMRLATFLAEPGAGDADDGDGPVTVTLSRFPGRVGGVAANVNRWRAQAGLARLTPAEAESQVETFSTTPGVEGYRVRIEGSDAHILAFALYQIAADRSYFVKAVAPPEAIEGIEAEAQQFVDSFAAWPVHDDG